MTNSDQHFTTSHLVTLGFRVVVECSSSDSSMSSLFDRTIDIDIYNIMENEQYDVEGRVFSGLTRKNLLTWLPAAVFNGSPVHPKYPSHAIHLVSYVSDL